MPKYHVWTVESKTHNVCWEVNAKTEEEAKEKAMKFDGKEIEDEVDDLFDIETQGC